ncbi:hypothetical protein RHMOL_Rhmol10G0063800 [Rhododendron molle]|uniref:Uncharacterized protein n=1 Tax=Rhododendron molle TaxID=49168 RepID=A0ACC0LZS2_RHOML|nr:hypothetical protein RHMOL_Rhmol10G0063800 [Rhododendron molle]
MEMDECPLEFDIDEAIGDEDCEDLSMEGDHNLEEVVEPKVGMSFDSENEARDYYTVTVERKSRINSLNPITAHPTSKTGCKASVNISHTADKKWMLNSIELSHNHEICPDKARYLKFNRIIPPHVKRTLELNDAAGIRTNKTITSCVIEAGGPKNLTFLEKDARNHLDKARRLQLKEGDAEAMHKYFIKMQADNGNFFYAMDVDQEHRLRSVFWADARSREAYKEFGDAVTFDTTYLVNKHGMPFAPFVGVNHHGQSVLFGCGLLSQEDTDSFVWLFEAWLSCMSGCSPNAIITDQCRALQNAISIVFPKARHRWCLWHILKKIPEKLKVCEAYDSIKSVIFNAVYDSLNQEEFEANWGHVIDTYELGGNEWLNGLYEERHRWVPAFVKDTFWAGMSTTQRSESINHFFDGYVHSNTTLKQFVEQYENAMGKRVQQEEDEDAHCFNAQIKTVSPYGFEDQFQQAYTIAKFKDFRDEVAGKISCQIERVMVVDDMEEFEIEEDIKIGEAGFLKTCTFHVRFNKQSKDASCTCRLFEFKGIVCKHMFVVWSKKKLTQVSEKYILRRWRKDVRRNHTFVKVSYANWERKPEWHRFNKMLVLFHRVADKAFDSDGKSERVMAKLLEAEAENEVCDDDTNRPMFLKYKRILFHLPVEMV